MSGDVLNRGENAEAGLAAHQFKAGNPGGPGRPKGARNKLGEVFIKAVLEDFEANGIEALEKVRKTDPSTYMRVIASILPKEVTGVDGESLIPPSLTIVRVAAKVASGS